MAGRAMMPVMSSLSPVEIPAALGLIAGGGSYPWQLARSARAQGVRRVVAFAFKGHTERVIQKYADETIWLRMGQVEVLKEAIRNADVRQMVMAGRIRPTVLFHLRPDARALAILNSLPTKNAHTLFGALAEELKGVGVDFLPACAFMETEMAAAGPLASRVPTPREAADIQLGAQVAKVTSGLDIGQTVVIKNGTVLAVEGFEGTDETIRRAGRLGGAGAVVVKVAKRGHDMRFDIPVIGPQTFRVLKKARISCLAVEAGRTILLEREKLAAAADRLGLAFLAFDISREESG